MFLKRVKIQSFKSFHACDIELGSQLNCITGHNGVGKSNLLDAILFALTAPLKRLRVSRAEDLILKAGTSFQRYAKKASVTLTLGLRALNKSGEILTTQDAVQGDLLTSNQRQEDHYIHAQIVFDEKKNAIVSYSIDGKVKRKSEVRRWIKEVARFPIHFDEGQDADAYSNFVIAQNAVIQLPNMSPRMKAMLLSISAGTYEWEKNREKVVQELEKSRDQDKTIRHNILSLEEIVNVEKTHIENLERIRGLNVQIEDLKRLLKTVHVQQQQKDIEDMKRYILELKYKEDTIESALDEVQILLESSSFELESGVAHCHELKENQVDLLQRQEDLQNLKDSTLVKRNYLKRQSELRKEAVEQAHSSLNRIEEDLHRLDYEEIAPLKHRLEALKKADVLNATGIKESMSLGELESHVNSLKQEMKELASQIQSHEQSYQNKRFTLQSLISKRENSTVPQVEKNPSDLSDLKGVKNERFKLMKEVQSRKEQTEYEIHLLFGNAWSHSLEKGYFGMLYETFELLPEAELYLEALAEILPSNVLTIHVTQNVEVSKRLLDSFHSQSRVPIRIWPLDQIQGRHVHKLVSAIQALHIHVTYPWDLVRVKSEALKKALYESPLTQWVIVDTMKEGEKLLEKVPHLKIITKDGNHKMHRGRLTGGYRKLGKASTFFKLKMKMDAYQREWIDYSLQIKEMEQSIDAMTQLETMEHQIALLEREMDIMESTLETLRSNFKDTERLYNQFSKRYQSALSQEGKTSPEDIKKLEAEIEQALQRRQEMHFERIELKSMVNEFSGEDMEDEVEKEDDTLNSELSQVEKETLTLGEELETLQKHLLNLKTQVSTYRARVEELTSDKMALKVEIQHIQKKLDATVEKLPVSWNESMILEDLDESDLKYRLKRSERSLDALVQSTFKKPTNKKTWMSMLKGKQGDLTLMQEKIQQLEDFKLKNEFVHEAVIKLEEGIVESKMSIDKAKMLAWDFVNATLKEMYSSIVVKDVSIKKVQDDGVEFHILSNGNEITIRELSGGEKTLLALCFILSLFLYQFERETAEEGSNGSKILLLDEVDAALDEVNCSHAVKLIKNLIVSKGFQVISISHHIGFSKEAQKEIQLERKEGTELTKCRRIITREE